MTHMEMSEMSESTPEFIEAQVEDPTADGEQDDAVEGADEIGAPVASEWDSEGGLDS